MCRSCVCFVVVVVFCTLVVVVFGNIFGTNLHSYLSIYVIICCCFCACLLSVTNCFAAQFKYVSHSGPA